MADPKNPADKPKLIIEGDWKTQARAEKEAAQPAASAPAEPHLSVDSDWKAQAAAEKQRLAEQAEAAGDDAEGGEHGVPPADFRTLISTLASQAMLYLGAIPDPMTGQRMVHLELAKHHIDLLGVLEEKTSNNTTDEEKQFLAQFLNELRLAFSQISKQVAAHLAQQNAGGTGGAGLRGPGGSGPILGGR